jgi:hypothetical protein
MTLLQYSQTLFLRDLKSLGFSYPHSIDIDLELRPFVYVTTPFFGGGNWLNMEVDLSEINEDHKKYFCICLFTMTSADQNMYSHFRSNYEFFYNKVRYPKFGIVGFGYAFEKPCLLLTKPTEVNFESIPEFEIKEFIHHQFTISSHFLGDITPNEFFTAMINDVDFNCECEIFRRILNCIKSELNITN